MASDLEEARSALRLAGAVAVRQGASVKSRVAMALGWVRIHEAASPPATETERNKP